EQWVTVFAASASPHLGALCLFMFGTGARIGEAVALTWNDVDLAQRTALIRQTKVNDERLAHMPPPVVAALANIPSNRNPDDLVFRYVNRESVRKVWDSAIARAEIKKLSPHCCRHGFATTLLHRGVDVKTVAKLGGWKDVATLVKTYAHAMGDRTVTNVLFGTNLAQPGIQKASSN
ncbi:MAG: site-specific integrase, partial [Mesorhizobium sp.]